MKFHTPLMRRWSCAAACAPLLAAQAATVDVAVLGSNGKPLADAAVFLESKEAKAAARPLAGVELGQAGRQFETRVAVVTAGSAVSFPNRDTVRHHVYSFSPAKTFDLKLYSGTPANPVVFDKAGIAVLGCNIHDNMVAWVVVVETPYAALTKAPGKVRLENVPPGSYKLRTWHPDLPPGTAALEETLVVGTTGASTTVRLTAASVAGN